MKLRIEKLIYIIVNQMNRSKLVGVIITVMIVIGVVIFTIVKTTTSSDILRVGYMRIASHAPLIAAIENDIFKKYNLSVKAEYYPTTTDLIEALEQKKIDVAFQVTPDLAWKSATKTRNDYYIYFVAQSTKDKSMDGLYTMKQVTKDSLLHQTIGHFPGLTGKYMTQEILKKKYGLNPDDYTLVDANPAMQIQLLTRGEIKALFTYEPLGTIALMAYKAVKAISAPVEEYVIDPWNGGIGIFSSDLVTYRKGVAINFQKAIKESFDDLNAHPSKYTETLMDLQPGLIAGIADSIPNIPLVFSINKEECEKIRSAVAIQFKVYQDLGILNKDDSHYLKIFEPYNEN